MKKLKRIDKDVTILLINIISKRGKLRDNNIYADITCNTISTMIGVCIRTVQSSISRLKSLGIIYIDKPHKSNMDRTNHYALNCDLLLLEHKALFASSTLQKLRNILYSIDNITYTGNILSIPIDMHHSNTDVDDVSPALGIARDPSNDWSNKRIAVDVATEIEGLRVSRLQIRRLIACARIKFSGLANLKKYIRTVQQSEYYKRVVSKYKDPLNWLLSFKVINKVFSGGFGVFKPSKSGDYKKPNDQSSLPISTNCRDTDNQGVNDIPSGSAPATRSVSDDHIDSLSESERCKNHRRLVAKDHGEGVYASYMTRVALVDRGDRIDITGSSFIVDYVATHYLNDPIFFSSPESQDFGWVERCEMRCC